MKILHVGYSLALCPNFSIIINIVTVEKHLRCRCFSQYMKDVDIVGNDIGRRAGSIWKLNLM